MTKDEEEELDRLLESMIWLEKEIMDCINDPNLDEFGQAYLRNLLRYLERDDKRLSELINKL